MAPTAWKLDRRFHESTSRTICRLACLLLGAFPLGLCGLFSAIQWTPMYHRWLVRQWQAELGQALDLPIELKAVTTLAPHATILREVTFKHPESEVALCRAPSVRLEQYRGQWLLNVDSIEMKAERFQEAWAHLHDNVLCRPYRGLVHTGLQVKQLAVYSDSGDYVLHNLRTHIYPRDDSTLMDLSFVVGTDAREIVQEAEPTSVKVGRYHDKALLSTHVRIDSGERPLPCSLVQFLVPEVACLGSQAELLGTVHIRVSREGWLAEVRADPDDDTMTQASIRQVDFAQLSWSWPGTLEAMGNLDIQAAEFGSSGIDSFRAAVNVGNGWISQEALQRMETQLGVSLKPGLLERSTEGVHFQLGFFKFALSSGGLRLGGYEPSGGTMLGGRNRQALAWRSNEGWFEFIPVANLAAALESPGFGNEFRPVSHEQLIGWLPKPGDNTAERSVPR